MSTAKKHDQTPESYRPKEKPDIISAVEKLQGDKVIDTVIIEGVEFTIIEKPLCPMYNTLMREVIA